MKRVLLQERVVLHQLQSLGRVASVLRRTKSEDKSSVSQTLKPRSRRPASNHPSSVVVIHPRGVTHDATRSNPSRTRDETYLLGHVSRHPRDAGFLLFRALERNLQAHILLLGCRRDDERASGLCGRRPRRGRGESGGARDVRARGEHRGVRRVRVERRRVVTSGFRGGVRDVVTPLVERDVTVRDSSMGGLRVDFEEFLEL